jgi:hypothetical protein
MQPSDERWRCERRQRPIARRQAMMEIHEAMLVALIASAVCATPIWGGEAYEPVLARLGAVLRVTARPAWPGPPADQVVVSLRPQAERPGQQVVSFGLPLGPGWVQEDGLIRVLDAEGEEIPTATRVLAFWGIDEVRGTARSVLVQFAMDFGTGGAREVTIRWDRPRARHMRAVPVAETEVVKHVSAADPKVARDYDYHCPKVLAVLPAEWLCASLIVWQQVPASRNQVAPWYDEHYRKSFPGSRLNNSGRDYSLHLFDRTATYVKAYARLGEEEQLLTALQAGDFYVQHLDAEGWFDLKPEHDVKYTFTEGPALLYLLTGDARYLAAVTRALKAWETWTRIEYTGAGFWTERHHGFGMLAYLHAYEATGEPRYLGKAKRYFEAAYRLQVEPLHGGPATGAWLHTGESHSEGEGWITSPWMSAFLTDAVWKYWMLTGDTRAPASLAMCASFMAKHAIGSDSPYVDYLATWPGLGKEAPSSGPAHNMEGLYFLAMAYYLSGGEDKGLLADIDRLRAPLMGNDANAPGRQFTWRFRGSSQFIWMLAEARQQPSRGNVD